MINKKCLINFVFDKYNFSLIKINKLMFKKVKQYTL